MRFHCRDKGILNVDNYFIVSNNKRVIVTGIVRRMVVGHIILVIDKLRFSDKSFVYNI